jgi:hypothetical protein
MVGGVGLRVVGEIRNREPHVRIVESRRGVVRMAAANARPMEAARRALLRALDAKG